MLRTKESSSNISESDLVKNRPKPTPSAFEILSNVAMPGMYRPVSMAHRCALAIFEHRANCGRVIERASRNSRIKSDTIIRQPRRDKRRVGACLRRRGQTRCQNQSGGSTCDRSILPFEICRDIRYARTDSHADLRV